MNDCLILYHSNCLDGFWAAKVAHRFLSQQHAVTCIAVNYNESPPEVTDKLVYIVDFSYPRETLLAMRKSAERVVVIDHHKTAQEQLQDLPDCVFDMDHSGCVLTWKYFATEDQPIPQVLLYVEDRDLWRFNLPNTRAICAALYLDDLSAESVKGWVEPDITELVQVGETVLRKEAAIVTKLTAPSSVSFECFGDYEDIPCVNSPIMQSEVGNVLAKHHPFAAVWYEVGDTRFYSLRSDKNNPAVVDVSAVAKRYGGGGHANAAGFSLKTVQREVL